MEYSVTLIGSTVVSSTATASSVEIRISRWNRLARTGEHELAPLPAEELRHACSRRTGRSRRRRRTWRRRSRAARRRARACRARRATGSPTWPRVLTSMPARQQHERRAGHDRERQQRRRAGSRGTRSSAPARGPCASTSPRRRRRRRRTPRTASSPRRTGRSRSTSRSGDPSPSGTVGCVACCSSCSPVRAELPDRDREHDERQARQPEDVLHRRELHPPHDQPHRERGERDDSR